MTSYQKVIFLLLLLLSVYVFWPGGEAGKQPEMALDVSVDAQGHVHVLGIVLAETALADAEHYWGHQSDRALFVSRRHHGEQLQLEAFFEDLPKGDRVVLTLAAGETLLRDIKDRAYHPLIYPNGNVRVGVAPDMHATVAGLVVQGLTYIPGQSRGHAAFAAAHGEAERVIRAGDNTHFLHPELGLDYIVPAAGREVLQFVNPAEFDLLRAPLLVASGP